MSAALLILAFAAAASFLLIIAMGVLLAQLKVRGQALLRSLQVIPVVIHYCCQHHTGGEKVCHTN